MSSLWFVAAWVTFKRKVKSQEKIKHLSRKWRPWATRMNWLMSLSSVLLWTRYCWPVCRFEWKQIMLLYVGFTLKKVVFTPRKRFEQTISLLYPLFYYAPREILRPISGQGPHQETKFGCAQNCGGWKKTKCLMWSEGSNAPLPFKCNYIMASVYFLYFLKNCSNKHKAIQKLSKFGFQTASDFECLVTASEWCIMGI